MTKFAKTTWLYIAVFSFLTLAAVTLRAAALILELQPAHIYFNDETLLIISAAVCLLVAGFALSYVFITDRSLKLYASFRTAGTYIPSGISAVALLLLGGELFAKNFIFPESDYGYFSNAASVISFLTTVLSIVCALSFFFNVFHEKKESTARASFCLLTALFLGCYAGYLFFSEQLPINSPNKAADQLAYLALAIFFLYETRISLGRAKWRFYFAFGLIAACLAYYSAVPSLIYLFTDRAVISNSIAENVLTLTLGVYVTFRVALMPSLSPDRMCDTAAAIAKMAEARSADIQNHEKLRGTLSLVDNTEEKTDVGANYRMDIPEDETVTSGQQTFNFDES